jgi:hypothetical protein
MSKHELLRDLRAQTGIHLLPEREFWSAPQFACGVARGIVVELLGNARTEWLLQLFKMHPEPYILWVEKESLIHPTAIYQRGVKLERIQFVHSTGDLQQPLRMALESQHYPFIVAPNQFSDIRIFQRLSLLAEKSKSTLFFLGDQKFSAAWPISLQLNIQQKENQFEIFVQRQKHGVPS